MFITFVNVLYREHKYQSTSDEYKSHLCFLIIANRKTNRGWFGSLFVFSTEWHQTGKQSTVYTEEVVFLFLLFWWCERKMKIDIMDHIPISLFCFWIKKKENETWLPHFHIPLGNRRTKNERTVYTTHGAFPFFLFSSFPVFQIYTGLYLYFFVCLRIGNKEKDAKLPFFYFLLWNRKTKTERTVYTRTPNPMLVNLIYVSNRIPWKEVQTRHE